jgi:hypothetical protein
MATGASAFRDQDYSALSVMDLSRWQRCAASLWIERDGITSLQDREGLADRSDIRGAALHPEDVEGAKDLPDYRHAKHVCPRHKKDLSRNKGHQRRRVPVADVIAHKNRRTR